MQPNNAKGVKTIITAGLLFAATFVLLYQCHPDKEKRGQIPTPTTQAQAESTWRSCVLETLETTPPLTAEITNGQWYEDGDTIFVIQDDEIRREKFGSSNGSTIWKRKFAFKFSFNKDTGEGYWFQDKPYYSGKVVASRESEDSWVLKRMLKDEVRSRFLFKQL